MTAFWSQFAMQVLTGGREPQFGRRGGCRELEMSPLSSPAVTSYMLPIVAISVTILQQF